MGEVLVIGGGLAGAEAAWQAAERGVHVTLVEMRPVRATPAHTTAGLAELVCSNSFKSEAVTTAHGLLKEELRTLSGLLVRIAGEVRVPAGSALAVDRAAFSAAVEAALAAHPRIAIHRAEQTALPADRPALIATGPLTSDALAAALAARIAPEQLRCECTVEAIEATSGQATLTLSQQGATQRVTAGLVVHAEGTPASDPNVSVRDYRQHAIIAQVKPTAPHNHRAWERFTPDGPLALLPLGDDYSVVFTVPSEKVAALLELDDDDFLATLREQFGRRAGFVGTGARSSFPLALRVRSPIVQQRQIWIGNSAQTLHPVSGQGFNLGLRDAAELAAALLEEQGDCGDAATLTAYARGRQTDRRYSMGFTDGIVRLFSNDFAPLRCARGLGLLALDLAPPLRHFVAKRMIWGARAWP